MRCNSTMLVRTLPRPLVFSHTLSNSWPPTLTSIHVRTLSRSGTHSPARPPHICTHASVCAGMHASMYVRACIRACMRVRDLVLAPVHLFALALRSAMFMFHRLLLFIFSISLFFFCFSMLWLLFVFPSLHFFHFFSRKCLCGMCNVFVLFPLSFIFVLTLFRMHCSILTSFSLLVCSLPFPSIFFVVFSAGFVLLLLFFD